jgi:outer membrane protein assembly factor BamB
MPCGVGNPSRLPPLTRSDAFPPGDTPAATDLDCLPHTATTMNHCLRLSFLLIGVCCGTAAADDWPQWRGPNRDGVWRESGIIEKFAGAEIPRRWTAAISGGYCGPTVADGRVYVADRLEQPSEVERVHCFDWTDGKRLWTYAYDCEYTISYRAGPRASVTIDNGRAYAFGSMGHLHCLDAATGKLL